MKFLWRMVDETIVGAVIHVLTCRLTGGRPRAGSTRSAREPEGSSNNRP
jgi:hypothetical protein